MLSVGGRRVTSRRDLASCVEFLPAEGRVHWAASPSIVEAASVVQRAGWAARRDLVADGRVIADDVDVDVVRALAVAVHHAVLPPPPEPRIW